MCGMHNMYQTMNVNKSVLLIIHLYAAFANNITQQLTTIEQKTTSYQIRSLLLIKNDEHEHEASSLKCMECVY